MLKSSSFYHWLARSLFRIHSNKVKALTYHNFLQTFHKPFMWISLMPHKCMPITTLSKHVIAFIYPVPWAGKFIFYLFIHMILVLWLPWLSYDQIKSEELAPHFSIDNNIWVERHSTFQIKCIQYFSFNWISVPCSSNNSYFSINIYIKSH